MNVPLPPGQVGGGRGYPNDSESRWERWLILPFFSSPSSLPTSNLNARGAGRKTGDYRRLSLLSTRRDVDDGRIGRRLVRQQQRWTMIPNRGEQWLISPFFSSSSSLPTSNSDSSPKTPGRGAGGGHWWPPSSLSIRRNVDEDQIGRRPSQARRRGMLYWRGWFKDNDDANSKEGGRRGGDSWLRAGGGGEKGRGGIPRGRRMCWRQGQQGAWGGRNGRCPAAGELAGVEASHPHPHWSSIFIFLDHVSNWWCLLIKTIKFSEHKHCPRLHLVRSIN